MLDYDLADLYQISTKRLKEQGKRNKKRFPSDFMFPLLESDLIHLKSQSATSRSTWGGSRIPPLAFSEHGIAMLSSVLSSDRAIAVNITIMRAYSQMRRILLSIEEFATKLKELESRFGIHDQKLKLIFDALRKLMSAHSIPAK